ncbi:hypothetical protein BAUCODRAFT_70344 [Baudoinia panamericana UAMH 10762]|uniref:aminodeoxychorismate synthase n=1 Tax=Baudoinia panamericana (strain UAMH 10762) TaxID=717646 RepID=M2NCB7_BAUPA|nr:uncharacterized protein BAUCODRAFT_70344 [Baudoinia panamericana UAMH 10762]EMC96520.1 hypothetical protein BAUCODRAFT_70344 [Baudoinia panamericana UAMH 10762]
MNQGRILFLDAYDSFSNNIVSLLRDSLPVTVECIKINDARFVLNDEAFRHYLHGFDAVVAGPGPGHPANPVDVGVIGKLWSLSDDDLLPVLGICLGFQSLALAFGASVHRLPRPRHGLVRQIEHCDSDIFANADELNATLYHSLHVRLRQLAELIPLARTEATADGDPILMGLRHRSKPFWGVQYHPESVCSSGGPGLVQRWWDAVRKWNARAQPAPRNVGWMSVQLPHDFNVASLVSTIRNSWDREPFLLESGCREGKPINSETGRFTIIGMRGQGSLQLCWSTVDKVFMVAKGECTISRSKADAPDAFRLLDEQLEQYTATDGLAEVPFWGGLVGYISYEAGLATINVAPTNTPAVRPDIWFELVERSVVIDHVLNAAYVQSIKAKDEVWLSEMESLLRLPYTPPFTPPGVESTCTGCIVSGPDQHDYCRKVSACQDELRAGESYELCLTEQTLVRNAAEPWSLYQELRHTNPAPFGAYLRFHDGGEVGLDVIGSSPERFLSWSRSGRCQFRPIKGTVKKTPGMTREDAEAILFSEKEQAENLMIVDLIRHDLSGTPGSHNVSCPKLMQVEEYETVFQLVSVIEGDIDRSVSPMAALSASLPPGSMTGAPKKRSCKILRRLEGVDKPRGLYSGVVGYLEVGGGGDFSVVIRTAYKWFGEDSWHVGAGGAVTALSDEQAEWEEMLAKRQSLLDVLLGAT